LWGGADFLLLVNMQILHILDIINVINFKKAKSIFPPFYAFGLKEEDGSNF